MLEIKLVASSRSHKLLTEISPEQQIRAASPSFLLLEISPEQQIRAASPSFLLLEISPEQQIRAASPSFLLLFVIHMIQTLFVSPPTDSTKRDSTMLMTRRSQTIGRVDVPTAG
ncbi:hypothetical protein RRG08_049607 [Elysia crispata]|uniref:Uncharacterized protein n=1 Tax=Elysia crispata TaxID=231223 RepID=A0AAE1E4Y6_9GAST|nr:hypothetical protein RRG08_049607 [Elysia crispata]